ncbi:MAG: hypothetical protein AMXMBFR84_00020 [Candidatus Hydrogenedentota bacterium]
MNKARTYTASRRGAALLVALAMVGLFSLLGTAWVRFALIDSDESKLRLDRVQARHIAESGVQGAIADLQAALANGGSADGLLTATREYPISIYRAADGTDAPPVVDESRSAVASVSILDESARINLNFAPPAVLSRILNVSGETARQIRRALPDAAGEGLWLSHVDELLTRNLIDGPSFEKINPDLLTVYTAADTAAPQGYINVNSASREVLEAVLDVPSETATRVMAARPLTSLEQLAALAGKDPSTFGVRMENDTPGAMPRALSLTSRCYRIRSEGVFNSIDLDGTASTLGAVTVEAVVLLPEGSAPRIMYWNATARQNVAAPENEAPAVESPDATAPEAASEETPPVGV